MTIIVVYDVDVKRVSKVCKCLRRWLNWVQNSVFEGQVTSATLRQIQTAVSEIIDPKQDSVMFYVIPSGAKWRKEVLGIEKLTTSNIL